MDMLEWKNNSANSEFIGKLLNNKFEEFQLKLMSIRTDASAQQCLDGAAAMKSMYKKINSRQQKGFNVFGG